MERDWKIFIKLSKKMDINRIPKTRKIARFTVLFDLNGDAVVLKWPGKNMPKSINYLLNNFPWKTLKKVILGAGGKLEPKENYTVNTDVGLRWVIFNLK